MRFGAKNHGAPRQFRFRARAVRREERQASCRRALDVPIRYRVAPTLFLLCSSFVRGSWFRIFAPVGVPPPLFVWVPIIPMRPDRWSAVYSGVSIRLDEFGPGRRNN